MKTAPVPVAEITATAITLLCREIGAVNTARFLNQFTTGFGNYTKERDEIIGNSTVDQLIAEIKKNHKPDKQRAKPSRRPSRPSKRAT